MSEFGALLASPFATFSMHLQAMIRQPVKSATRTFDDPNIRQPSTLVLVLCTVPDLT
jgi:hypothetical protein